MPKKVLHEETQLSIFSPFATSDFKGLCSILLPPFISPPVWSAPSYSAVPQMEVTAELWSPMSLFPDLCKFSYSALSCSRLWGGAGSVLFLTIIDILWGLIAETMFLSNISQKVILRYNPSTAWDTSHRHSALCTWRQNERDKGDIFLQRQMWPMWHASHFYVSEYAVFEHKY